MRIKRYSCFIMVSIIVTGLLPITSYAATGQELVNYANGITGTYDGSSSGRKGPNTFDCSGFVWYCCNAVGINISSGNTDSQKKYGAFVDCSSLKSNNNHSNLQIGDLIFFDYGGDGITDHVGIYSGNGKIRHCWSQGVVTTSLTSNFYSGDSRTLYSVVDSVRRIVSSGGSSTSTPGQPILKNMKATYTNEEEILFSWDKTVNTTSYNWYIDKYDASSAGYKGDHYVRLGHEDNVEFVRKTLPIGKYRVCVTAYNTNYYKDSEWIYFEVISKEDEAPEKPIISIEKTKWRDDETIIMTWQECKNADYYFPMAVDENGNKVSVLWGRWGTDYKMNLSAGTYNLQVWSVREREGKDSLITYSDYVKITVLATPGQPILKGMKEIYTNKEEILFSWDKTVNTTSYNWYIDKYDASSAGYKGDHYVRLGHEDNIEFVRKTLPIGKYRVCVTSYNTNYYKDSEWIYFEVIDEKPFTKTFVTKNDYGYIVETVMYNLDENCEVIVVGYNDNRFITLKPAIQQEQSASCTLVGDIDEIKVMAWESIGNIKPLCDAVVVPQSEWIIE